MYEPWEHLGRLTFDEIPGPWALLLDRLRPRASQRYRLPSLVSYLLNVSILYSVSRQAESRRQCDLYLNPPLLKIGLLQWNQFDTIVSQGEQHARAVLEQAEGQKAEMRVPNALTAKTLAKSERAEDVHHAKDADDLFKQLGV